GSHRAAPSRARGRDQPAPPASPSTRGWKNAASGSCTGTPPRTPPPVDVRNGGSVWRPVLAARGTDQSPLTPLSALPSVPGRLRGAHRLRRLQPATDVGSGE